MKKKQTNIIKTITLKTNVKTLKENKMQLYANIINKTRKIDF